MNKIFETIREVFSNRNNPIEITAQRQQELKEISDKIYYLNRLGKISKADDHYFEDVIPELRGAVLCCLLRGISRRYIIEYSVGLYWLYHSKSYKSSLFNVLNNTGDFTSDFIRTIDYLLQQDFRPLRKMEIFAT